MNGDGISSGAKKSAECVMLQVREWAEKYPGRVALVTLTEAEQLEDLGLFQKQWRNLTRRELLRVFERVIAIWERQRSGRLHWHLIVLCQPGVDVRTGTDVELIRATGGRRGANEALRAIWREVRTWERYGFGRNRVEPLIGEPEQAARYAAGYVTGKKDKAHLRPSDRGRRRVRWLGFVEVREESSPLPAPLAGPGPLEQVRVSTRNYRTSFCWNRSRARVYRARLGMVADIVGAESFADFEFLAGRYWAFHLQELIQHTVVSPRLEAQGDTEAAALAKHQETLWECARIIAARSAKPYPSGIRSGNELGDCRGIADLRREWRARLLSQGREGRRGLCGAGRSRLRVGAAVATLRGGDSPSRRGGLLESQPVARKVLAGENSVGKSWIDHSLPPSDRE